MQTALGHAAEALAQREAELQASEAKVSNLTTTAEQAASALARREQELRESSAEAARLREAADAASTALERLQQELSAATSEVCSRCCSFLLLERSILLEPTGRIANVDVAAFAPR